MKNKSIGRLLFFLLTSFSLLLVFSNKSYLLVFVAFFIYCFFYLNKNLLESLFFTAVFALPFERGIRDWIVEIVQPGPEHWFEGYSYYFSFSVKMIFLLFGSVLLFLKKQKIKFINNISTNIPGTLLVLFLTFTLISSAQAFNPLLSALVVVRLIFSAFFFFFGIQVFKKTENKQIVLEVIFSLSIMLAVVGIMQFFIIEGVI